jgi:transketolase
MTVLVPSDERLFGDLLAEALRMPGPVYLRCDVSSRSVTDREEHRSSGSLPIGGGRLLREGTDVTVCCCGMMVFEALEAAMCSPSRGSRRKLVECYSVKPLPEQILLASCVAPEPVWSRRSTAGTEASPKRRGGGASARNTPFRYVGSGMDDVFGRAEALGSCTNITN